MKIVARANTYKFAIKMINKRKSPSSTAKPHRDILARLLEVSEKDPSKLTFEEIIALTTTNLIAGSDSTAIGLRAILYFLCRTPRSYARLQAEVDGAFDSGALTTPVKYADGTKLPYLNAVVTEALRAHAATGFVLEREVPEGGVTIAGQYIPAGTIVGVNSWVMHANKSVYGEDAESFRPERWLDEEGEGETWEERVREMKRCNMAVSGSFRLCYCIYCLVRWVQGLLGAGLYPAYLTDPPTSPRLTGTHIPVEIGDTKLIIPV